METAFRWAVLILLAALIATVIIETNRILRYMPGAPDVQDVHVVNTRSDAVPVEGLPSSEVPTQYGRSPGTSTGQNNANGLTPSQQAVFDNLYGPSASASTPAKPL